MEACETLIQETATKHAPWYVVRRPQMVCPNCHRRGHCRGAARFDLAFPDVDERKTKELQEVKD